MASSGFNQGITKITVGGTTITYLINAEFNQSQQLRDTTNKDSTGNWRTFAKGLLNATMTAEAFFDEGAAYGFGDLWDLQKSGATVTYIFTSGVSGDNGYSATGLVQDLGKRSPNLDGSETVATTVQLSGAVTETTEA